MILQKTITIKLNKNNRNYYKSIGCSFCDLDDEVEINIEDMPTGSKNPVKVKCDICGKVQSVAYRAYLKNIKRNQKYVCQSCSVQVRHNKDLKSRQEKHYQNLLRQCKEDGYELLDDKEIIKNNNTYIHYKCPKHGIHTMKIANLLSGKGCPDCVKDKRREMYQLDKQIIIDRVKECGGELLNPNDYINQAEKNLLFKCINCKNTFVSSFRVYTQHGGQLCKECSNTESLGEKKMRRYLEEHNLFYIQEHWFPDCRDTKPLPFDFYLPTLNLIIEFDGRQHFEDTKHFTYSLETVIYHDKIKNDYCKSRNIHLLRISYKDINHIENILDNAIKQDNLHKDIV